MYEMKNHYYRKSAKFVFESTEKIIPICHQQGGDGVRAQSKLIYCGGHEPYILSFGTHIRNRHRQAC